MSTKGSVLLALAVLGLLDAVVLGVPILALVLIYVVLARPPWFRALVGEIYGG